MLDTANDNITGCTAINAGATSAPTGWKLYLKIFFLFIWALDILITESLNILENELKNPNSPTPAQKSDAKRKSLNKNVKTPIVPISRPRRERYSFVQFINFYLNSNHSTTPAAKLKAQQERDQQEQESIMKSARHSAQKRQSLQNKKKLIEELELNVRI